MRAVPLDARPCRPGELPHRFRIVCERALILDVVTQAARDGIPVELWVRIAVEAARVRDGIVAVSGLPHALVQDQLDTAASEPLREVVGCGELGLYARLLRDRAPSRPTRAAPGDNLSVRVSDTIRCAWLAAAAADGLTLDGWVTARLQHAPGRAIDWEAAAASSGLELGEWGYCCAARRADSAAAHTLD